MKQEYEKLTEGNLRDLVEDVRELLGDGDGGSLHLGTYAHQQHGECEDLGHHRASGHHSPSLHVPPHPA
jgi:hypothetical protein